MAATILVVDDEKDILELLRYNLEKEGHRVLTASDGRAALKVARQNPDLIVLDVMMPEMDGWDVCKAIRTHRATAHIPIIFLTARDSEIDEVVGLELGADDYIRKPVKMRTFIARVKRVLRAEGAGRATNDAETLLFGELEIHLGNYFAKIRNEEIRFPKKEFDLLVYLACHPDRIISREKLLNEVWGHEVYVVERTVDVHIRKIREKLGRHANRIETVKGVGYRFKNEM